jgi:hypothetical protein
MAASTTQTADNKSPAEEEKSSAILLSEWHAAMTRLEDFRRQHSAVLALQVSGKRSPGFAQLEQMLAAAEAQAMSLRRRLFKQAGLPH